MDASVRLTTNNLTAVMGKVRKLHGIQLFIFTGHSNFAVTAPDMTKYIVTDMDKLKTVQQLGATGYIIFRTKEVWDNLLKWGILCSLHKECIAPMMNRLCNFGKGSFRHFAGCHRFDQSLLNILLSNWYNFNWDVIKPEFQCMQVQRRSTHEYERKTCT